MLRMETLSEERLRLYEAFKDLVADCEIKVALHYPEEYIKLLRENTKLLKENQQAREAAVRYYMEAERCMRYQDIIRSHEKLLKENNISFRVTKF